MTVAELAGVAWAATAAESVDHVFAHFGALWIALVQHFALVHVVLAMDALKAEAALALVFGPAIHTTRVVSARRHGAVVHHVLALGPVKA